MLRITGVKLQNISEIDMHLFLEQGLRGRTSYIAKRYSKANSTYMKNHDLTKPSIYIQCLDMNNCWKMSEYLPYGRFKWLKKVDNFDVNSISEKGSIRYILQVDLEYPDELHVLHNNYPLALEKLAIPYDMLLSD